MSGLTVALVVKNPPANAGDIRNVGLIPGSGRSSGIGNGDPLQYFCLEIPMDRGACWVTVHGVAKSWIWSNRVIMHNGSVTFSHIVGQSKSHDSNWNQLNGEFYSSCGRWRWGVNICETRTIYRVSLCLSGKEFTCQCRRWRFDPWVGKIPSEGNGNPLQYQYSCLGNPSCERVRYDLVTKNK